MKTLKKSFFFCLLSFVFALNANAQTYQPLTVTGFNADVVCNAATCTGITSLDNDQWYFYSANKKAQGALPQSVNSPFDITYQLESFEGNNALRLAYDGTRNGVLTLATPVQAKEIWLLGMSASGKKDVQVTVNYTDGSHSQTVNVQFSDWFQSNNNGAAVYGLGRVNGNTNYDSRLQFGLFERAVPVDDTKSVQSISFYHTSTDKSFNSIFAVSAYFGGRAPSDKHLYMIANAHFDTQWLWDVQTSIDQYVKNTLEGNFNLFANYPNYKFNFEGAIKYMFAKEYYPDLYTRLKGYIAADRWRVSGSSVDANDVMVPSSESIIRNLLLGHKFFQAEFGVDGGNDIMLPDCFGFPYTLPTLAAHCGIIGFHSQKLSWGSAYSLDNLSHYGLWRGVDGSEILAIHKPGAYVTQYHENMAYNGDVLGEIINHEQQLGAKKTVRYFGTGDRGGSVDTNTADWLEKSLASNGPVIVHTVSPDEFFNTFTPTERATLPVWDNELPMTAHGVGCYSSQTILKFWNRKGELLADATEKSSVVANFLGTLPYQQKTINDAWVRLLWHQFHDDLTGTSIPKAYVFSYNDHVLNMLDFSKTLTNATGAVTRKMNTEVTGTPVVVYNPLSIVREDIVEAHITLAQEPTSISVYNKDGNVVPTQKLKYENGVLYFIFKANVPSLGYATYDLRENDNAAAALTSTLQTTPTTIENEDYLLTVNAKGDVSSIKDKTQNSRELLAQPIRLSLQSDQQRTWPSWEVSWEDVNRTPIGYVDGNVQVTLEERGPLRAAFKISRTKNGSQFVQFVRMTSGVNADRIDFINEVNWQSRQTLLKVVFPLAASNAQATYDCSIGTIKRGNETSNLYEVAGHQWADITHNDNSFGVSILNDCKYGWDKPANNQLRLTLIHTPATLEGYTYEKYQDLGLNKFNFAFFRHLGTWKETTQWAAAEFNQPLVAYQTPTHAGTLGKEFAFANLNSEKVAIKAMKKAESTDEIVVRVYELTGEPQNNVELSFTSNIASARKINGREQESSASAVSFTGNKIAFNIGKYEPITFAVRLVQETYANLQEPTSRKAELTYNIDVMSNDQIKSNGRFGTTNFVFPAELFEDEITSDGIKFSIGSRANNQKNAVKCTGQEISIPQSATNKKLYILAASDKMEGSTAKFLIDGVEKTFKVEYVTEQVGTWGNHFGTRNYRKENVAFTATHRHNLATSKNDAYSYLYIYKYAIEINAESQTLTLPNDESVIVFAVTASDNENDNVTPITDIQNLPDFEYITPVSEAGDCGERLAPQSLTSSGQTNVNERREYAADNNSSTKWNDDSGVAQKWLQYTFNEAITVCSWSVLHAGIEGDEKITADFSLQIYNENTRTWTDIDAVTDNTENKTWRIITPVTAKTFRLRITKAQQDGGNTARIYSFDLFGNSPTDVKNVSAQDDFTVFVNENKQIVLNIPYLKNMECLTAEIFNTMGQKIYTQALNSQFFILNSQFSNGIYLVKIGNVSKKVVVK